MRYGLAISVIGHLAALTLGLIFAGASPFDSAPAEAITVDIVSPDEVGRAPDAPAPPPPTAPAFEIPTPAPQTPAAMPPPAPQPQPTPRSGPQRSSRQAAVQPVEPVRPPPAPPAQSPPPTAAPQEPNMADMFGLPLALPDGKLGGGFDAPAIDTANIAADDTKTFRSHLKTCLTLPGSVAPTEKIRIVLRVSFKPDGTLAATPTLIEASASAKGPTLLESAVNGLRACQPYAMLPASKYKEWKVLDLSFTPHDFAGG